MSLAVVLIVQAAAVLAVPATSFDLRTAPATEDCTTAGEEIVVCGRRTDDEAARLRPLPEQFAPAPVRATIGLGRGTLGLEGEQASFSDGTTSNRIMLKLKLPF